MLSSAICGMAATGITLSKVRPCPAWGSMPFLTASAAAVGDALQLGRALFALGMGVAAGVEFDDRRAEADGGGDLGLGRLDEQADADVRRAKLVDIISEVIVLPRGVEPALGGALLALLGDDAGGVRLMAKRDGEHLLGRRHFEVQRQVDLGHQPVDVVVGDVAAVFAQVRGDAVGAGLGRHDRGADRDRDGRRRARSGWSRRGRC